MKSSHLAVDSGGGGGVDQMNPQDALAT
eukprot:SAG31_NODE_24621_length_477_cov_3.629630_1_plen_27_part_10